MPQPTPKDPAIDNMLTSFFSRPRSTSIKLNVCVSCGGDATRFKDELSRREYEISGLCQVCQDQAFAPLSIEA